MANEPGLAMFIDVPFIPFVFIPMLKTTSFVIRVWCTLILHGIKIQDVLFPVIQRKIRKQNMSSYFSKRHTQYKFIQNL